MSLRTRLRRLEQTVREPGCPACRERRGRTALVTARQGEETPPDDWPRPCPRCGDIPEQVVEIAEVVVETHEQARAALAEVWSPSHGGRCGGR